MTYSHAYERNEFKSANYWPDPDMTLLGSNRRPAPAFPVALLGPFWGAWAARAADCASAPVDYPACALLASAGASIANVRWPVAGAGWSEPPLLWMGLVGSPSSGKSPGMEAAFSLIRHAEDSMAAGFEETHREYETNKYAAEAAMKAWKAELDTHAKNPTGAAPSKPLAAEEPEAPVRPRIRVADATTERLATLSAGLHRGLLLARDELSGWVANFDRYGGNGGDRSFYLESYGGRSYRVDRMRSPEPISIRHLSVGVLGTTQPDRLSAITGGADDGLACRFLWSWPDRIPKFRLSRVDQDERDACYAFNRLLGLTMGSDTFGNVEPIRLKIDPEGEKEIEKFAEEMSDRAETTAGAFSGAIGKARGQVLRLATVLEFVWWAGASGREPEFISKAAVEAACALMDEYFIPMAERVFGDAAIPQDERLAMTLVRRLRSNRLAQFNAREVRREAGGDLREASNMTTACNVLVDHGLIRHRETNSVGRPAKVFDVHPAVYGRS